MNCPYCQASNVAGEHRCQRCVRRLDGSAHMSQAYGRDATARALQVDSQENPERKPEAQPGTARRRLPFQPSLFQTRVVSFESFAPEAVETRPRNRTTVSRPRHKRE